MVGRRALTSSSCQTQMQDRIFSRVIMAYFHTAPRHYFGLPVWAVFHCGVDCGFAILFRLDCTVSLLPIYLVRLLRQVKTNATIEV